MMIYIIEWRHLFVLGNSYTANATNTDKWRHHKQGDIYMFCILLTVYIALESFEN